MNYKIGFWIMAGTLFLSCVTRNYQERTIAYQERSIQLLQAILDDPHHCVSVCQEEFDKMGC